MRHLFVGDTLKNGKYRIVRYEYDDEYFSNVYSATMAVEIKGPLGTITSQSPVTIYEFNNNLHTDALDVFDFQHRENAIDTIWENNTYYYVKPAEIESPAAKKEDSTEIIEDFGSYMALDPSMPYTSWKRIPVTDPLPFPDKAIDITWSYTIPGTDPDEFDDEKITKIIRLNMGDSSFSTASLYCDNKLMAEHRWFMYNCNCVRDALRQYGFLSKEHWENESDTLILSGTNIRFDMIYNTRPTFTRHVKSAMVGKHDLLLNAVSNFFIYSDILLLNVLPNNFIDRSIFYGKRPEDT